MVKYGESSALHTDMMSYDILRNDCIVITASLYVRVEISL
jgi:hypothetical protein